MRVRATIGEDYSYLPLGHVMKGAGKPLIKAGLKLVFLPFSFADALDRLANDKSLGDSKGVTLALSSLLAVVQMQLDQHQHQDHDPNRLADWPYDIPPKPVRPNEAATKKWIQEAVSRMIGLLMFADLLYSTRLARKTTNSTS
jgi:hypothetical protein